MVAFDLARKRKNLSLEETLIDGVERLIKQSNVSSFSAYVESLLAAHLIANNIIPPTYLLPGETRGGDRTIGKVKDSKAK